MENYEIVHKLGSGAFGVTYKVINKTTKEELAMKCIRRGDIDNAEYVEREILNHRVLRHPNIIQFKEVILNENMLGIVMELADSGELLSVVLTRGVYTEDEARKMFQQLMAGVAYIHSKSSEIQSSAKTKVGTPDYWAPEVGKMKIGSSAPYNGRLADVWSCGVTLYKMLTNERLDVKRDRVVQCIESLNVSDECKDLFGQMLHKDPTKRITVEKIKLHDWYVKDLPPDLKEEAQAAIMDNRNETHSCQTEEDIMKIVAKIKPHRVLETVDEAVETSIAAQDGIGDIADKKNGRSMAELFLG